MTSWETLRIQVPSRNRVTNGGSARVHRHGSPAAGDLEVQASGQGAFDIGGVSGILTLQLVEGDNFLERRTTGIAKNESVRRRLIAKVPMPGRLPRTCMGALTNQVGFEVFDCILLELRRCTVSSQRDGLELAPVHVCSDKFGMVGSGNVHELSWNNGPPEGLGAVGRELHCSPAIPDEVAVENSVPDLGVAFMTRLGVAPRGRRHRGVLAVGVDRETVVIPEDVAGVGVVRVDLDAAGILGELLLGPALVEDCTDAAENLAAAELPVCVGRRVRERRSKREGGDRHATPP